MVDLICTGGGDDSFCFYGTVGAGTGYVSTDLGGGDGGQGPAGGPGDGGGENGPGSGGW
jgi:hypothetical protein